MAGGARSMACTFCKKRKRKCDGEQPCSICQKYNRNGDCEYLADQDKRKFKYDSTYIDYLELKLDLLEQLADGLIRSNPQKALELDPELFRQRYTHDEDNQQPIPKANNAEQLLKDLANEKAIEELISTKWKVRQDFGGYTEFYGPVSGRQEVIESIENEEYPNVTSIDNVDCDEALRLELIDHFLKHFGNYFFISKLTIGEVKSWSFPSQEITKQLLMFAIFTFGSVFKKDGKNLSSFFLHKAESLAIKACKKVDEYVIQALLILSCYDLGMGLDSNSWIFDAMSSSITQYLKLDRLVEVEELSKDQFGGSIPSSRDSAVLFWSVILQDRIITSVLGRGCRLQYFRIKTEFLVKNVDVESTDLTELTFSYHSQLWFIHDKYLSQIYSFKADHLHNSHRSALMNQGVDSLNEFYSNLPDVLKYDDSTKDSKILILHLSYSVSILLFHRAYLKQIPLKVIQITIIHCEKAGELIQRLIDNESADSPHFISYLILTCATFDLFLMSNKDESLKLKSTNRIIIYVEALKKFGKYWKRCLKDIKVLSELSHRWNLDIPILNEDSIPITQSPTAAYNPDINDYGIDLNVDEFFHQFNPSPESV